MTYAVDSGRCSTDDAGNSYASNRSGAVHLGAGERHKSDKGILETHDDFWWCLSGGRRGYLENEV